MQYWFVCSEIRIKVTLLEDEMTHNEKKLANIVEELTMFFFSIGAKDVRSAVHVENNRADIEITADYREEYRERVDALVKYFNEPKNEGLEDFYWELAGSGDPGESSQLLLIGMMIDNADVQIEHSQVRIKLSKELQL